jgi:hypothetical protein
VHYSGQNGTTHNDKWNWLLVNQYGMTQPYVDLLYVPKVPIFKGQIVPRLRKNRVTTCATGTVHVKQRYDTTCTSTAQNMYMKVKFWALKIPYGIPTVGQLPNQFPKATYQKPRTKIQSAYISFQKPRTKSVSILGHEPRFSRRVTNPPEQAPFLNRK